MKAMTSNPEFGEGFIEILENPVGNFIKKFV